jgi:hypothetical protein
MEVKVTSELPRLLMVRFWKLGSNDRGYVTNAYGPLTPEVKRYFIGAISQLGHLMQDQHWIIRGDFNLITSLKEKKVRVRKLDVKNKFFKGTLDKLSIKYLPT